MSEPKLGSTRLVRCDEHNIAVERYDEITNNKTKEVRREWREAGYYGHRLDYAAESALFLALPIGESITPQMVKDAVATIVANTKEVLK